LNTGIANGSRSLYFDGTQLKLENVDLVSSSDGEFDDLSSDSLTANRMFAKELGFSNLFAVSDYVQLDADGRPIIDDIDVRGYFCWIYGCRKKVEIESPYTRVGSGNRGGIRLQTYPNTSIVPYDYQDLNTKYRMKKKRISFSIKINQVTNDFYSGFLPNFSVLRIYIFEEDNGFPSNFENISQSDAQNGYLGDYLAKLDLSFTSSNLVGGVFQKNTAHFKNNLGVNLFEVSYFYGGYIYINTYNSNTNTATAIKQPTPNELYITCTSDNEFLNYTGSRRLKVGFEYECFVNASSDDDDNLDATVKLQFILEDNPLELNAINDSFD
jgi:hypothetical protein